MWQEPNDVDVDSGSGESHTYRGWRTKYVALLTRREWRFIYGASSTISCIRQLQEACSSGARFGNDFSVFLRLERYALRQSCSTNWDSYDWTADDLSSAQKFSHGKCENTRNNFFFICARSFCMPFTSRFVCLSIYIPRGVVSWCHVNMLAPF